MKRANRHIIINYHGKMEHFTLKDVPEFISDKMLYQMITRKYLEGHAG